VSEAADVGKYFDSSITRIVLERVDGELIVVDVEFDGPVGEAERIEVQPSNSSAVSFKRSRR